MALLGTVHRKALDIFKVCLTCPANFRNIWKSAVFVGECVASTLFSNHEPKLIHMTFVGVQLIITGEF